MISGALVLIAGACALTACGPSAEEQAAKAQQAQTKKVVKKQQPVDPLAGMSSAVTGTKGTLPLEVRFELLERPEPHKPAKVRLAFMPSMDLMAMHAVVKAAPGLQIADDAQIKFDAVKTGEIKELQFVATPSEVGILLANIDVTVTRDTGDTTFNFSIPIPVPDQVATSGAAVAASSK
jgi:hypothetical protein